MGQFERTLIICEEGADVHYIEGCTAPVYSTDSLDSAVVEIVAKKSSRARATSTRSARSSRGHSHFSDEPHRKRPGPRTSLHELRLRKIITHR